jgi:PAS domain S-box-containing protein/putative nucleotidyltransferase with HDIG domain
MMKKQVLIVEDERIVADDIRMSLERLGYSACGIVSSGEQAVEKTKGIRPDLVLMDIVLEGKMNGIEAAEIIRSGFDIPIVYLTAYSDNKTLERAKMSEPFGYVLKPFEDRDLQTTIEMALYKHKMEKLLRESEEKYRSLAENAYDAIYVLSQEGFQYANRAFEKLTGWKKEDLDSRKFNFWDIAHPDEIKLMKSKRRGRMPASGEFRIVSKDGSVKVVEVNSAKIGRRRETRRIGILRDITERKKAEEELEKSLERLKKTFEDTVNALVSALERRDPYTAGHQKEVANLACAIAVEMRLSKDKIDGLRLAGLVHDVGKIQIPTEILGKPGHLSETEFLMIKIHPRVGYDILRGIDFPYPIADIVLQHHERMDGSGYPEGLSGEQILLEARILAVADVVEAMSSQRPFRPALGIGMALEEVSKHRGRLYERRVVNALLRLVKENRITFE